MCFTNVNEAGTRYRYFMYSTNKCTDFNKNITLKKKKKLMNRVCPNVRHENITLWSSWRLKFIHSQFPLPMTLNSVLLKCQTET